MPISVGDVLTVRQRCIGGEWLFGAAPEQSLSFGCATLSRHLARVGNRLSRACGPPLKVFTSAVAPFRTAVAIYSMILNGYAPTRVLVYGEHQWTPAARRLLAQLLPFATFVPTTKVLGDLTVLCQGDLPALASSHWTAMKICATLLSEPAEFCQMDDDVIVLANCSDALDAFRDHDLVFAPDADYSNTYTSLWGPTFDVDGPLRTGRVNTGLLWCRRTHDAATWT